MAISEDFDRAAVGLRRAVDDAEDRIADAAPNQRPEMERKLAEALTSVEHLQPLGARSRDLRETASEEGIYSAQNLRDVNARFVSEGRDKLTAALDGTGIDPVEVEARMRVGANSAALEARWVQQDLQAVADLRGLDLRNEAQLRQAIDVVDRAYDRVAEGYGVDDAIAARARTSGNDAVADYDQRFPRGDTSMADEGSAELRRDYDREMAQMEARQLREAAERGEGLPDEGPMSQEAYRAFMREQTRIADEPDGRTEPRGDAFESIRRGHDQALDTDAQLDRARRADADAHQPTASIGAVEASLTGLREFARPVGDEDERKLREAIERTLTRDALDRLKRGDAEVLRGVGDREDQLTMARDYLRGLDAPGTDQALQRVNEALAAERDQVRQQRGHEGPGHD